MLCDARNNTQQIDWTHRKCVSVALCSVLCDPDTVHIRDAVLDIYAVNIGLKAIALCTGDPGSLWCCFIGVA